MEMDQTSYARIMQWNQGGLPLRKTTIKKQHNGIFCTPRPQMQITKCVWEFVFEQQQT